MIDVSCKLRDGLLRDDDFLQFIDAQSSKARQIQADVNILLMHGNKKYIYCIYKNGGPAKKSGHILHQSKIQMKRRLLVPKLIDCLHLSIFQP